MVGGSSCPAMHDFFLDLTRTGGKTVLLERNLGKCGEMNKSRRASLGGENSGAFLDIVHLPSARLNLICLMRHDEREAY